MYRVIAADDENMVRLAMNTMIDWTANGFEFCGAAADGLQALAMAEEYEPDLVITDIRMPNMDGLELIKKLKEDGFKGEILILSNYDDFDLVRAGLRSGAYDYLLKVEISQDSLPEKIREIKKVLDKKEGEKIALTAAKETRRTGKPDKKEWEGFLFKDDIGGSAVMRFPLRIYVIRLWCLAIRKHAGINEQAAESLLADMIRNNQESLLLKADLGTYVFLDIGDKMLSTDIKDKIQNQMELYLNLGCHVVYTGILTCKEETKSAYTACMAVLDSMFYEEKASALRIPAAVSPWNEDIKVWERSLEEELAAMLSCGKEELAQKRLDHFLTEQKEERADPEQVKVSLCHLLSGTYYILPYREEILWDMETAIRQIKEGTHVSQLRAGVYEFAEKCVSKTGASKKEVVELKYYIDHHLSEKLTLSYLKDQVNLSEKYMCTIFKQVTGKSIMGYINEKRLEKAGELLLTTDKRMKEIGEKIGIPDQFYLSKLFKRHYGVTPTQYKNENPYK